MTPADQSKIAVQRNEIGRLTRLVEALTAESKRRRILLVNALHNAPGWRAAVEDELNLSAGVSRRTAQDRPPVPLPHAPAAPVAANAETASRGKNRGAA